MRKAAADLLERTEHVRSTALHTTCKSSSLRPNVVSYERKTVHAIFPKWSECAQTQHTIARADANDGQRQGRRAGSKGGRFECFKRVAANIVARALLSAADAEDTSMGNPSAHPRQLAWAASLALAAYPWLRAESRSRC